MIQTADSIDMLFDLIHLLNVRMLNQVSDTGTKLFQKKRIPHVFAPSPFF